MEKRSKQKYTLQFEDCSPLMLDPHRARPIHYSKRPRAHRAPPCPTMLHNAQPGLPQCRRRRRRRRPRERERERERTGKGERSGRDGGPKRRPTCEIFGGFSNFAICEKMDFQNTTWNLGSDFYDPLASFEATAACTKTSAPWNLRSITNKYKIWRGQNLLFPRFQQNIG